MNVFVVVLLVGLLVLDGVVFAGLARTGTRTRRDGPPSHVRRVEVGPVPYDWQVDEGAA